MPKKKEPKLEPRNQFKLFQEAAREHEVEPSKLETAFKKLAAPKPKPKENTQR